MTIIDNKNEEIKCLIEEVDCQSSVSTLRYREPKFRYQDMPNQNREEAADNWEINQPVIEQGTENNPLNSILNTVQEENCLVEEIDCKQSLINFGYDRNKDKTEVENVNEIVNEPIYEFKNDNSAETYKNLEDITSKNVVDAADVPLPTDYSIFKDISDYFSNFDINNFLSSSVIASVVDCNTEKDSTPKGMEESAEETEIDLDLIENTDEVTDKDRMETEEEVETEEEMEIGEEMETREETEADKIEEIDNRNNELSGKNIILKKDWVKKVLHTGEIYMENKIGFLCLLSVLGFVGIFTDSRACLGLFGFLYFIRYFFLIPDENFKTSMLKAAKPAFFTNITISVGIIILWILINKVILFSMGLVIGMTVSLLVFAVMMEKCLKKSE